jgi:hypothetical protein
VVGGLGVGDCMSCSSVEGRSISLGEVIGLDVSGGPSEPFPVDLIEIVRLQDEGRDDTSARGSLERSSHCSEEKVL